MPTSGSPKWEIAPGEAGIRVRMYRVGFGDFFLLSLCGNGRQPVHVVIDCGVFKGTKQTGDLESIKDAVADMEATTGGEVALIVMTHRHADHIAGFARCADVFRRLKVGAVWMPIWESEYSPAAKKFQAELTRTASVLQQHFASLGASQSPEDETARRFMENAIGESSSNGGGPNAVALDLLKRGFAGVSPDYYAAGDKPTLPPALQACGLTAKILGPPPLDDLPLMKLMDVQKGVGQYLAAVAGDGKAGDSTDFLEPFGSKWEITPFSHLQTRKRPDLPPEAMREWIRRNGGPPFGNLPLARARTALGQMEKELFASQPQAALTAAKQLNSFLNNQSLVILFEFGGKRLLFVGDAQAGNWEHWLFKTDQPNKKGDGAVSEEAREILSSLHFYKVGHHGSGNATPKAAVEAMCLHNHGLAAMCSTQADVYGNENIEDPTKGTEVPRIPLLDRLAQGSTLVRSDQLPITVNNKTVPPKVTAKLPASGQGFRFKAGSLWIDCFL